MIKNALITAAAALSLAGCLPTPNIPRYGEGYDRDQENIQKKAEVQQELDRREAAKLDEKTRRDLDRAVEEKRSEAAAVSADSASVQ